ncbi:MAG: NAD-dependent epimerase/dehydratase family protein [Myxococcota bacterium]
MRCLITGATGFIGGAMLRGLQDAGHEVVAYVRESSDSRALMDVQRVVGDLADPNRLAEAASGCDAVIHAAGIADPTTDRETLGWAHVAGTENVINAAKRAGCHRLIHISCADVTLHDGPRSFWNEDESPPEPLGELARSKLHAEEIVRVSGSGTLRTITLRPALVWGPGDTTHLPRWREEANAGGVRLVGGGKKLLATTHTKNLARAAALALEADIPSGSVYYIVDTELSVSREFFTEICEALDWTKPKNGGPYRWMLALSRTRFSSLHPTQVVRRARTSAFDANKAKQELGYEPAVTRQEGLVELKQWAAEEGAS